MTVIRPNDPGIIPATSLDGDDRFWFFERDGVGNLATKLGSFDLIRDYLLPNGLAIIFGTDVPQASEGKVNDVFFNINTGIIYKKTNNTTWTQQTNLITEIELTTALGAYATDAELAAATANLVSSTQLSSTLANYVLTSILNESIDDRVAALLQASANISLSYNDPSGRLTIAVTGLPEVIDDRVTALLQGGAGVNLVYDEENGTLTISATATGAGGHTIQDGSTTYPQRSILTLLGFTITDDVGGDRTVVQALAGGGITYTENTSSTVTITKNTGIISRFASGTQNISLDNSAAIGDICGVQGAGLYQINHAGHTIVFPNGNSDTILRNVVGYEYASVELLKLSANQWAVNKTNNISGLELITGANIPIITSVNSANATIGEAFNYQITATGSPTSFSASNLPSGLAINTATGLISGSPTAGTFGTASVTLGATNALGTGNLNLSLKVSENIIKSAMDTVPMQSSGLTFTSRGSGMSVDSANFVSAPASIAFTGNGSQSTTIATGKMNGNFILSAQIKPNSVSVDQEILTLTTTIASNQSSEYQIIAEISSPGKARFVLRNNSGATHFDISSAENILMANTFQLIEFIVSGQTAIIKHNNIEIASTNFTGTRSVTADKVLVGELSFPSAERRFNGNIDDLLLIRNPT